MVDEAYRKSVQEDLSSMKKWLCYRAFVAIWKKGRFNIDGHNGDK
jgi:hypothetical protein